MSLSSFLLKVGEKSAAKGKAIDTGLDELFRTNQAVAAPLSVPASPIEPAEPPAKTTSKEKKRKHLDELVSSPKSKKLKAAFRANAEKDEDNASSSKKIAQSLQAARSPSAKLDEAEDTSAAQESEDDSEKPKASTSKAPLTLSKRYGDSDDSDSDEEVDPSKLVHETVANNGKHKNARSRKAKYVPEGETREQRDSRTVFVGNVPIEAVKTKSLQKQLKRHILSFAPTAKIESVRFRSVAFAKPTTQLPPADGSTPKSKKEIRRHDRDRAASWRAANGKDEDEASGAPEKTFLTPAEKKRIAFIKHDFHEGVDAANAYVVFAHPIPDVSKKIDVMDPYKAALKVAKEADGTVFGGRTIRTDLAGRRGLAGKADGEMLGDPKATIFVGNLDFASKEEDLRAFFEALMVEERGNPGKSESDHESEQDDEEREGQGEDSSGDEESNSKGNGKSEDTLTATSRASWVKRVRIIRDKDTLLGKGFAYVQFTARDCVDEILALEPERLKFAKRKLRVQRCKTLPGAPKLVKPTRPAPVVAAASKGKGQADKQPPAARAIRPKGPPAPVSIPKGDPHLGERLAGLSKEQRKRVKATDADRVARRLAKKRAKALAEKGVKSGVSTGKGDVLKVRKRPGDARKGAAAKGSAAKKTRVRSGKALAKMNAKK